MSLRKAFHSQAQFIMTSHNPEAIRRFSDDNTLRFSEEVISNPLSFVRSGKYRSMVPL